MHLSFSPPRPVGVFGSVIQISALSVLHIGKQFALSNAIAPQLVGHDHPRHILQTLQKLPEKAPCSVGITPTLNKNVEHDTILIDGTLKIVLHALDPDKDFIHVPFVPRPWPAASQAVGIALAEFPAPAPYGLVGDDDASLELPHDPGQRQWDHR